jgi:hypothetical protein
VGREFEVRGSRSEKRKFGDVDTAVEYINSRPHETFTIVFATDSIIAEIRRKVRNTIFVG